MNIDNLKNNLDEREILSADEQQISRLVGGLDKVSAPRDFDFRLKARIESAGEKGNYHNPVRQTLRYVLAPAAAVIAAAFVLFQTGFFTPQKNQPNNIASANMNRQMPVNRENSAASNKVPENSNPSIIENKDKNSLSNSLVADSKPTNQIPKKKTNPPKNRQKDNFTGFKDIALSPSNTRGPKGINPEKKSPDMKNFEQKVSISAKEILNQFGIEIELAGENLKVKSVKESSVADRSGVKTGDIVEAIDDQKLDQGNLSPKFKGGKSITVLRENKLLKIELKPY